MSLETALSENTAAMRELIALLRGMPGALAKAAVQPEAPTPAPVKVEKPVPTPEPVQVETPEPVQDKAMTQIDAIHALNRVVSTKGPDFVRSVFDQFGKQRLTDFAQSEYGALFTALEA